LQYAFQFDQDVNATNAHGSTLMHAAVRGTLNLAPQAQICAVIQFLADHGAPLDERDEDGRTPLSIADFLPIDKAVDLLTELIAKAGKTPKIPSVRKG
jgi:ankyrin repeat protein